MDQLLNGALWGFGFFGAWAIILFALLLAILGLSMLIIWAERKGW